MKYSVQCAVELEIHKFLQKFNNNTVTFTSHTILIMILVGRLFVLVHDTKFVVMPSPNSVYVSHY